ncbi:H-type small acid-soluble spore protein [Brevibacillus fulvus]|uniref:Small acid-soluble spore protein H (Minor) n=1 Tax=Brevibacillus fulvus TaxID=1125967 RepID=A0A938Y6G6_9BACL|nr:H-type small acid-soluble spore protein [Brevibacillus fulvus]MBM7592120.1 small acid-soluble spore protein H (minor) [Brevibacillus fulvus]
MNIVRAQEILQTEQKIEVEYQGKPVWIDHVDEETATASVHLENNPANKMTVEVNQLIEK